MTLSYLVLEQHCHLDYTTIRYGFQLARTTAVSLSLVVIKDLICIDSRDMRESLFHSGQESCLDLFIIALYCASRYTWFILQKEL